MKNFFAPLVKCRNFRPIHSEPDTESVRLSIRENNHQPPDTHMIAKKPSPKGKSVRVTFELPAESASNSAAVAGSFNEWDVTRHPMKLDKKKGVWTKSISFKPGETVEFRYFIDESEWRNEEQADSYAATPYFSENSVLAL